MDSTTARVCISLIPVALVVFVWYVWARRARQQSEPRDRYVWVSEPRNRRRSHSPTSEPVGPGDAYAKATWSYRITCILATLHGFGPLLVSVHMSPHDRIFYFVILFWSWPLWLVPLIRQRRQWDRVCLIPLGLSLLALLWAAFPALMITQLLLGGTM